MNTNLLNTCLDRNGHLDVDRLLAGHREQFGSFRMDKDDDSDEDDDDDQDDDDSDEDDDDDQDDDDSDEGGKKNKDDEDPKLGRAGQKALEAIKARDKKNRARIRRLTAENESLKATKPADKKTKDDEKPDADQIREQARREADAEILSTRVMDKIEAKAGGRFDLDPEDVAALVMRRNNVEDFLDEDNKIDVEAIADALDKLLKDRPALASKGGKRFNGGGDGGRRKDTKAKPKSLEEAITSRLSSSKR